MAENRDLRFSQGNERFQYRVGAIILENDRILMVGNDKNDYFYSVGGAVQFGESAEEACVREVKEETGLKLEIDRLVFIHENFFIGEQGDFLQDVNCHELGFYFLMKSADSSELHSESLGTDGSREFLQWIPIADYKNYQAFPTFFADELQNLPEQVKRIVTHE